MELRFLPSSPLKMTAACCPTALFPPPRSRARDGVVFLNSSSRSQLSHRVGLSFRARKSVRVSCVGDNNKTDVVTFKSWDKLILKSDVPVLVEFHTSWCGPCRMVHRVIDEIATDYSGRLKCFVLNADQDPKIAEGYDIKAVPVVLMFRNGERCESIVGTMPKEFYVAAIERVLASS